MSGGALHHCGLGSVSVCTLEYSMNPPPNWLLILLAVLALTVFAAGISYKYTGDFTGLTTWGTRDHAQRR